MIRQHLLQKERLKLNHENLVERYFRLLPPATVSEFRAFGTNSLPGRNYSEHLRPIKGKSRFEPSDLAVLSRSRVPSPDNELQFWIEKERKEYLPKELVSMLEHRRIQQSALVNAEKFEPVKIYEHPVFGPTPAYIKPIFKDDFDSRSKISENQLDDNKDQIDEPQINNLATQNNDDTDQVQQEPTNTNKDNDDDDSEKNMPPGYMSYKKWKKKYENLIPVNPLLFNIFAQRSNNSIQTYGRSLYSHPTEIDFEQTPKYRRSSSSLSSDDQSDTESIDSRKPLPSASSIGSHYDKLIPRTAWKPYSPPSTTSNTTKPIVAQNFADDRSENKSSSESPVPFLSRTSPVMSSSKPIESTDEKESPVVFPEKAASTGSIIKSSSISSMLNTSSEAPSTSNIPPAPPLPPSLLEKPLKSNSNNPPLTMSEPSVLSSSKVDQEARNVSGTNSLPTGQNPIQKSVTFAGNSTATAPKTEEELSSDDSDDSVATKTRKKKQKRKNLALPQDESSSSDD